MKIRIITGIILTIVILGVILFAPAWGIQLFLGLGILGAAYEYIALGSDHPVDRYIGTIAVAAILSSVILHYPLDTLLLFIAPILLIYLLFFHKPMETAFHRLAILLSSIVYPGLLGAAILMLPPKPDGRYLVLVVAAIAFIGDTAAYFGGKTLGKHKLWPQVSPKKTWEGSISGVIGSIIAAVGVQLIFPAHFSITKLAIAGLIGAPIGQMGDLIESVIKRSAGVKDSGNFLPGHGGLFDRLDAFLMVGVFVYLWTILIGF